MTTEQRMYELFLNEFERDYRELEGQVDYNLANINDLKRLQVRLSTDIVGWSRQNSKLNLYIKDLENDVRLLFQSIGKEVCRSEILLKLNKPKC